MRTVARLANEASWLVAEGTADADAVDTAMRLGTNYPIGPLAWAEQVGVERIVTVLDNLARTYGDGRYRICPQLRRIATMGGALASLDTRGNA